MIALAGYRNIATTQRYIDLRPGVLRNAVVLVGMLAKLDNSHYSIKEMQ